MILFFLSLIIYQCSSQGCYLPPFNFINIGNFNNYSITRYPPDSSYQQTINFAPCSLGLPGGCGYYSGSNQCYNKSNCCAVCYDWDSDLGITPACLGLSKNVIIREISSTEVVLTYYGGDPIYPSVPRQVDIIITCDPKAQALTFLNFIPAKDIYPPPPAYIYTLILSSNTLCTPPCNIPGFNFKPIAAKPSYDFTWKPPGGSAETISLNLCSNGLPKGCGTLPVTNQCANTPNCCAACQTWVEDVGPVSACLGLSKKLLNVTAISDREVKLSYGGGDLLDSTPRQVDINIFCDFSANDLTFIDFITPVRKVPPPSAYIYTLILTSNVLCGSGQNRIEEIMNKLSEIGF